MRMCLQKCLVLFYSTQILLCNNAPRFDVECLSFNPSGTLLAIWGQGGITVLENLARLNARKDGTPKMRSDRTDRPTHIFGNGESAKVDGRATLEVEAAGSLGLRLQIKFQPKI